MPFTFPQWWLIYTFTLLQTAVVEDNVVSVAQAVVNATDGLQNTTNAEIEEVAKTLSNIVGAESDDPKVFK